MLKFVDGVLDRADETYTIIGLTNTTNKVIIEKKVRYGIYFDEIRKTNITRKLNSKKEIRLCNTLISLKDIPGI